MTTETKESQNSGTKDSQESETPAANGNAATGQAQPTYDNGAKLTASYWKAIDKRNDKGEIPAAQLTAVKAAYAKTAPPRRSNLVKALNLEAADRILTPAGEFDQTIAQARLALSSAIDEARKETTRSERPPHDPVPDLARHFWAIEQWREETLADLTDDQRKALTAYKVDPNEDETKAAKARVDKALASTRKSALNGRNGHAGPRTPAAEIEAKVREVVHNAEHPLTTGQLAKLADISQSTAYTRWEAETPGVKTITGDKGERLFVKDTDPA